ncbi:MAG: 30S ribosomal protein S4e [Nanoarchaeota archaeon]
MSSYLKRYAAPRSWTLLRKETKYVMKSSPGAHAMEHSMPIGMLLKSLGHASTTKEAGLIMRNSNVLIDGRRIKDHKFALGLMDTVTLKESGEHYRVVIDDKARIMLAKISGKDAASKACRVLGKTVIKGGKLQLNLSGGRCVITDKKDLSVGDTVMLSLPDQKITSTLKLEKDATILLTAGRHAGTIGTVEDITEERIRYATKDGSEQTLTDYAFVIPEGMITQ